MTPEDRKRCIILVPFHHYIEARCDVALRALEARGYRVQRSGGGAAIDRVRSELATHALEEDIDEILWIDADMAFEPDAVDSLRAHGLPLIGGLYARRGQRGFSSQLLQEQNELALGDPGGLIEARYLATGFLLTHRRVYEDIARKFDLPLCNASFKSPAVPYFLPMVRRDEKAGWWYLSEDWSFCERAIQAGYKPMLDTSIRLWHIGNYRYGWEDVATPIARVPGLRMKLERG